MCFFECVFQVIWRKRISIFRCARVFFLVFFECVFGEKRISIFRCARVVFLVSFESVFSSVFLRFFVFFSSFGMILVPFSSSGSFNLFFFPRACVLVGFSSLVTFFSVLFLVRVCLVRF